MALSYTVSNLATSSLGNRRGRTGTITFAATSTASDGGDTIAASTFGLSSLDHLALSPITATTTTGFIAMWTRATGKLHVLRPTTAATNTGFTQVDAGVDLTGQTFEFFAIGK